MVRQNKPEFDPISANTLFHFTNSIEHILNILTIEFQPRYCVEDFRIFRPVGGESLEMAIPMVSFCDLPLFSIKKHLSFYGSYGIGMSKAWGKKRGISPVLYLTPNSPLSKSLGWIMRMADVSESLTTSPQKVWRRSDMLSSYVKPYEGDMRRNGKYARNVRFYDEREWRFVPDSQNDLFRPALSKRDYDTDAIRIEENAKISHVKLHFTPSDIKYLIVKTEDEILPMIHSIEAIKGKFEPNIIKLLTTRIMTLHQIRDDF